MGAYESAKLKEELDHLLRKDLNSWEELLSNVALFFVQHEQPEIAKNIWSFICTEGEYTLAAIYNLSSYYLQLAKKASAHGLTAKPPPLDLARYKDLQADQFHPDRLMQELMTRNEKLVQVE